MTRVDVVELREKVKAMYREVAEEPDGDFHFEMGRPLAERLGYPADALDVVPSEAIESFAGVGHHLGLAAIATGESVVAALEIDASQANPQYHFTSDSAQGATEMIGVKSVSVLATKPAHG